MADIVERDTIIDSIKKMNSWHPNLPLILVLSRQNPGPEGVVFGNVKAVRETYDILFNLDQIGIQDDARKYYLHFCHDAGAKEYPFALKKPTVNYGKTHQRIIKDTFSNPEGFLTRVAEGEYVLKKEFSRLVLKYLKFESAIDLRPLLLFHYWNSVDGAILIGDLWKRFCESFHVNKSPFEEIFTCSGLDEEIPLQAENTPVNMRSICLPHEYGTGACDADFWNRFRSLLEDRLRSLKWQGRIDSLASGITSALMQDQSVFLLGSPGTGKTTIVTSAILPALRAAYGTENELRFSEFPLTPASTTADLFGFQGLDGRWVKGPFVRDVMLAYAEQESSNTEGGEDELESSQEISSQADASPHLVFFDEANRVDIEALLSPIQASLDRMQARKPGGVVTLGSDEYVLPKRVWRIFAGNSPATDLGRKEQSRPFKRRMSVVLPPDPMSEILVDSARFRKSCIELLMHATEVADTEFSEPALALLGDLKTNHNRLEDLRLLFEALYKLPQVAVTVGLLESVLLRAASHKALKQDSPLDASLVQSLVGLISGDANLVAGVVDAATQQGFTRLATTIQRDIMQVQSDNGNFEIDPLL